MEKRNSLLIAQVDLDNVSGNIILGVFSSEEAAREAHERWFAENDPESYEDGVEPWGELVLVSVHLDEVTEMRIEHDLIDAM